MRKYSVFFFRLLDCLQSISCWFGVLLCAPLLVSAAPVLVMPGSPAAYAYFPPQSLASGGASSSGSGAASFSSCTVLAGSISAKPGASCLVAEGGVVKFVGIVPCDTIGCSGNGALVTTPVDQGLFFWSTNSSATCYPDVTSSSPVLSSNFDLPTSGCSASFASVESAVAACADVGLENTSLGEKGSWRLPRGGELVMLYHGRETIGGFSYDATGSTTGGGGLLGSGGLLGTGLLGGATSINPNSAASSYWSGIEIYTPPGFLSAADYDNAASLNFFTGLWDAKDSNTPGMLKISTYRLTRCVRVLPLSP